MVVWDGKIHNLSQPFRTMNHKGLKSIFPPKYDHPPKKLLSQVGHSWLRKRQHQPPTKNQQIQGWINESTRFSSLQRIPQPFKFICEIIGLGLRRCGGEGKTIPIPSMFGIFTYIWLIFMVNVGKYTIHGSYGIVNLEIIKCFPVVFCVRNHRIYVNLKLYDTTRWAPKTSYK